MAACTILAGLNSTVLWQEDKSQNGCFKKTKHNKFSEKNKHFLPPNTHMYVDAKHLKKGLNRCGEIFGTLFGQYQTLS